MYEVLLRERGREREGGGRERASTHTHTHTQQLFSLYHTHAPFHSSGALKLMHTHMYNSHTHIQHTHTYTTHTHTHTHTYYQLAFLYFTDNSLVWSPWPSMILGIERSLSRLEQQQRNTYALSPHASPASQNGGRRLRNRR